MWSLFGRGLSVMPGYLFFKLATWLFGYVVLFDLEEYELEECMFRKLLNLITYKHAMTQTLYIFSDVCSLGL
jgi:hypothetical protein